MLMIGKPAPQFKEQAVIDGGEFKEISLSDYTGKWVVLFFILSISLLFVQPKSPSLEIYFPIFKKKVLKSLASAWTRFTRTKGGSKRILGT